MLSIESFRGYHAYVSIWTPVQDEILRLIYSYLNLLIQWIETLWQ